LPGIDYFSDHNSNSNSNYNPSDYASLHNINDPDVDHLTPHASSFGPSGTSSPVLLHNNNYQSFHPAPASTVWPADTFNDLSGIYGTSAAVGGTLQDPNFIAAPMPELELPEFHQSQLWSNDTTSYDMEHLLGGPPDNSMFLLPPPATTTRFGYHPRAYSDSNLLSQVATMRGFASEPSWETSEEEAMTGATNLSNVPRDVGSFTVRRTTRPRAPTMDRTPIRRQSARPARAGSIATRLARSGSIRHGGLTGSTHAVSAPNSPDHTHQIGQQPQQSQGSFSCPLSPYGCESLFWSKNEWKRHVVTKHLRLGYYSCELCPHDGARGQYTNSRKDLFSQHIFRMHLQADNQAAQQRQRQQQSGPSSTYHNRSYSTSHVSNPAGATAAFPRRASTSSAGPVTEAVTERYGDIYTRSWVVMRQPPQDTGCVFCGERFSGPAGCENWLEHVGRTHLVRNVLAPPQSTGGTQVVQTIPTPATMRAHWAQDITLRDWLVLNREIVWDATSNTYVLVGASEGGPSTRAPSERSTSVSLSPVAVRRPSLRVTVPVTPVAAHRLGHVGEEENEEEEEEEEEDDDNDNEGEEENGEEESENDTAEADGEGEPDYTTFPTPQLF